MALIKGLNQGKTKRALKEKTPHSKKKLIQAPRKIKIKIKIKGFLDSLTKVSDFV